MRFVCSALLATALVAPAAVAQITIQKVPPAVNNATAALDTSDLVVAGTAPIQLSGASMAQRLSELGLRSDFVTDGDKLRLTVVNPRSSLGTLSLMDVAVMAAGDATGWATVRGSVIARFNAQAGDRYLVDFALGEFALAGAGTSKRYVARIYSDVGTTPSVQEITLPKGPQHALFLVEAKGSRPYVVLTLAKPTGLSSGLSSSTSSSSSSQFVFYSAEISKLK